jgi:hypothetical protein
MRLVQVVEDTTMLVSGYEHQTWQCSDCDSIEQRTTFSRKKRQTHRAPVKPARVTSPVATQTAAVEPVRIEPVAPALIVPIQVEETAQAEVSQIATVETGVSVKATNEPEPPKAIPSQISAATLQTNASPKPFDEKLRNFMERATAWKEAAAEHRRRLEFKRDRHKLHSVPAPSLSSEALSHKDRDEPVRSHGQPAATPAPTTHDEPITSPTSERARNRTWTKLVRFGRHKGSVA